MTEKSCGKKPNSVVDKTPFSLFYIVDKITISWWRRAVREDEISVKKSESVTILSSNLSRGYLVHRPPTSQVPPKVVHRHHMLTKSQMVEVSSPETKASHLVVRAQQLKAGSLPIVFTSRGRRQENLQLGPSGFHELFVFRCAYLFLDFRFSDLVCAYT